jgi:hypothetical protein
MSKDDQARFVFDDPRDITIGAGRIVWAKAKYRDERRFPEGWVLPGGKRTLSRDDAEFAAKQIDRGEKCK